MKNRLVSRVRQEIVDKLAMDVQVTRHQSRPEEDSLRNLDQVIEAWRMIDYRRHAGVATVRRPRWEVLITQVRWTSAQLQRVTRTQIVFKAIFIRSSTCVLCYIPRASLPHLRYRQPPPMCLLEKAVSQWTSIITHEPSHKNVIIAWHSPLILTVASCFVKIVEFRNVSSSCQISVLSKQN